MDLIDKISVENFQSVAKQDISLGSRDNGGGLTLIVGPSSSGKSAILRAVRLLAHNSTSVPVRVGAKKTNVVVSYSSGLRVEIERGKSLSTYVINDDRFQKAGTSVPKQVEKTLNFYRDSHFAFQFDSPYLLAEPGSTITRVLGEVTNAHVLTEAVREGVRKKQEAASLAKTRRSDAVEATERLKTFEGLETRQKALAVIDSVLEALLEWQTESSDLRALVERHDRIMAEQETIQLVEPPDISEYLDKASSDIAEADKLTALVSTLQRKKSEYMLASKRTVEVSQTLKEIDKEKHDLLHELGICPTCGQDTSKL